MTWSDYIKDREDWGKDYGAVKTEPHKHSWEPDGESWKEQADKCPYDNKDYSKQFRGSEHMADKLDCARNHEHEFVRKRRYTCHCGASKVVALGEK